MVPSDAIPDRLKRAYQSALNVLSIGESEATAVTCRRVLEGITAGLLTDPAARRKPLAGRIQALANEDRKLAAPLIELSDTLRAGGNLGAHFDDEADTSIEDAERMVDLLDFLIAYLFVLPQRVHMFRQDVLGEGAETSVPRA